MLDTKKAVTVTHCNRHGIPVGKEAFNEDGRLIIPYDNPAGRRAYEVIWQVVENQKRKAWEAISKYIDETMPNAKIINEIPIVGKDGQRIGGGEYWVFFGGGQKLIYSYDTKTIEVFEMKGGAG